MQVASVKSDADLPFPLENNDGGLEPLDLVTLGFRDQS